MLSILLDAISFLYSLLDYIVNIAGYLAFFTGIRQKIRKYQKRRREKADHKTDRTK